MGAAASQLTSKGTALLEKILSSIVYFLIAIIVVGAIAGFGYYFLIYKRKFNIKVLIYSGRANDKYAVYEDYGAILTDRKTKSKYLRIWSLKYDLPLPKFNVMTPTDKGDLIEIYREGEHQFKYILPSKIRKDVAIAEDGTIVEVAKREKMFLDSDLDYWNVKRKNMNKKMIDTDNLLMKLLPHIPAIVGGIFIIFILFILLDKLPAILSHLDRLVASMQRYAEYVASNHTSSMPAGP